MSAAWEDRLAEVLVELADALVADVDVIEFLQLLVDRCVELLEVDAAAVLLVEPGGDKLRVLACSSERVRLLEMLQLNTDGPCLECYRIGRSVAVADLRSHSTRWPDFVAAAGKVGFVATHAVPMRAGEQLIGGLNLFRARFGELERRSQQIAQALASVATVGLLHQRRIRRHEALAEQLQTALSSRVLIEQAKGVLAARHGIDMDQAFAALRGYARSHNRRLFEVARRVVDKTIALPPPPHRPAKAPPDQDGAPH